MREMSGGSLFVVALVIWFLWELVSKGAKKSGGGGGHGRRPPGSH